MLLKEIFKNTDVKITDNIDIKRITTNSKEVQNKDLFIAVKGYKYDGHDYIKEAIKNGAIVILVDEDRYMEFINENAYIISSKCVRNILGIISSNYYNNPSKEFKLIGITGTKGKTTTSFMIKSILDEASYKTGLIGTVGVYIGNKKILDSERTTPDAILLQKIFRKMADEKCEYVIMEVSSQSLKLNRVSGSYFDAGMFTNFSEDHISKNEHESLEDYFLSKAKLFDMVPFSFINLDDDMSKKLMNLKTNTTYKTYGINSMANLVGKDINITSNYTSFNTKIYGNDEKIVVNIPGIYSVYNSLGAIIVSEFYNIDRKYIINGLKNVIVKGRSEIIKNDLNLNIIIDYAHSESSIYNILQAVKEYKKGKIITVFGCGGDRDKSKRCKMGEISGKLSDYTIITSDNPRGEDKNEIIKEIEIGIKKVTNNYKCIVDRKKAIKEAIELATKDDIILLLGKGHETYQEINGIKYPFDERIVIKEIIDELKFENK